MPQKSVKFSHGKQEISFDIDLVSKLRSELLYNIFYKLFDVEHADTPQLIEEAHRLRYQVFCVENEGYEDPADHPDGLEKDEFDERAEHALLIYKPTGKPVGTVRVIHADEQDWRNSFTIQRLCNSHYLNDETYVKSACEFSRLCISREARHHIKKELKNLAKGAAAADKGPSFKFYEKPLLNVGLAMAPLGLIRGAFELTMKQNNLNVFGIMEPRYIQRLVDAGLVHEEIGPAVEHHGQRVPFICNILETFENAIVNNFDIWNVVSVQGKNHGHALDIQESKTAIHH